MDKSDIYAPLCDSPGDTAGLTAADFAGDSEAQTYLRGVYERFLAFSVAVTAFGRVDLQGTGQGETYFATVIQVVGHEVLEALLDAYDTVGDDEDALRQRLFGDEWIGPVGRNIVKLWFSGTWYQLPRAWSQRFGPAARDVTFTVTPNAYVEGLLWTTIGAHPAGAKAPGYGSWAAAPRIPDVGG